MCLNQVEHVFKPSLVFTQTREGHLVLYFFQENEVDHVFKPDLVIVAAITKHY